MLRLFYLNFFHNKTLFRRLNFVSFYFIVRLLNSAHQSNTFHSVDIWWCLTNWRFSLILLWFLWWFWLIDLLGFWRGYYGFSVINWLISWSNWWGWLDWFRCSSRLVCRRFCTFGWFRFLFDLSSDRSHSTTKKKIIHVFFKVRFSSIGI